MSVLAHTKSTYLLNSILQDTTVNASLLTPWDWTCKLFYKNIQNTFLQELKTVNLTFIFLLLTFPVENPLQQDTQSLSSP